MLQTVGYKSMDEFIDACVPASIRIKELADNDVRPFSELELLRRAEKLAEGNKRMKSYIGMG
jgi:glycine dehydrogenase